MIPANRTANNTTAANHRPFASIVFSSFSLVGSSVLSLSLFLLLSIEPSHFREACILPLGVSFNAVARGPGLAFWRPGSCLPSPPFRRWGPRFGVHARATHQIHRPAQQV